VTQPIPAAPKTSPAAPAKRPRRSGKAVPALSAAAGRRIWLTAQRLDAREPFGAGPDATRAAVEHLGYVQIDTINVIERCHHHILWSRIPGYRREDLRTAQTLERSVFEYWTHALAYVPTGDYRFFVADMKRRRDAPDRWFDQVAKSDLRKLMARIRADGALTIRDIDDDVLVEKDHAWASRKPSKRALQFAFYAGLLTISARRGMLKTYELTDRHFGWESRPRPASERQVAEYLLDRALRSQGVVSLDSVCHLDAPRKAAVRAAVERRVRRRLLTPVALEGAGAIEHWCAPAALEAPADAADEGLVHILSPFDPVIIQRKRLKLFFGYDHRFEAYVPKEKRVLGYFALPVLVGDKVVAAIDCKTDRAGRTLRLQQWTWTRDGSAAAHQALIDEELQRFERFQLEA
jgi:uncharacterized protein YcaQ